ncbi:unnamed protein product [Paramecium sonneborni]|uniref:Uncharacterized protein n=1 Tax=Paramecium sonneborni TaxID=65129 RepID=A0A8S1N0T7_9CILI|nr:unnamed protein product [Paramecium sonneborni]
MGSSSGIGLQPTTNYIGLNLDSLQHLFWQVNLYEKIFSIQMQIKIFQLWVWQNLKQIIYFKPIILEIIELYIKYQKQQKEILRKQQLGFLAKFHSKFKPMQLVVGQSPIPELEPILIQSNEIYQLWNDNCK